MATTFRFIVEDKTTKNIGNNVSFDANGVAKPKIGAGENIDPYTGSNRGVEHNRYMRVINPVLNRYTGGWWEKGMRVGRGTVGVVDVAKHKGVASALTSVGAIIIVQFAIMETIKWYDKMKKEANNENQADYLRLKSGSTMLGKDYKITKNFFGKITYKEQ